MSCDIANGRLEACKDSVAGLDALYIINYGDYNPDTNVTFDGTFEDLITDVQGVANLYKYELKGANSFDQAITSSRDNGTTYFEQTLAVTLKKQDVQTHKTIKLLAYGRPHIVVRNRNNQFFLAGFNRGMDVTAGSVANGTALGDLSGYTLTFTGMENVPANFIDCATEAELSALFDGASIVTA
jgi:hypothetical protein